MTNVLTQAPDSPEVGRGGVPIDGGTSADPRVAAYVELFERSVPTVPSRASEIGEPVWLSALRRRAITRFAQLGFPTTKNEDWHFTNVAPLAAHTFRVAGEPSAVAAEELVPFTFGEDWHTLVFVNGVFIPSLSGAEVVEREYYVGSFGATLANTPTLLEQHLAGLATDETHAFTSLNTAFLQDGAVIALSPKVVVDRPIHLLFVTDANTSSGLISPRTLVIAGERSEATIVESYVSLGSATYFTNAVTELSLASGARVRHYKIQRESMSSYHVGASYAWQARDSHLESFSFATGAALSRTNISTMLAGPGAHVTMNGLYMVDGTQTVDHQTSIEHAREQCTSHEVYKGILDDAAHAVFNGKVYVRPEAQKTDGKQSNNNLLLSDRARVDTKPQLEIFADDVKCTHGATVGRLDETALFYLKSRGVGADLARRLLTYAFAAGVLEELSVDEVRTALERLTFQRFSIEG